MAAAGVGVFGVGGRWRWWQGAFKLIRFPGSGVSFLQWSRWEVEVTGSLPDLWKFGGGGLSGGGLCGQAHACACDSGGVGAADLPMLLLLLVGDGERAGPCSVTVDVACCHDPVPVAALWHGLLLAWSLPALAPPLAALPAVCLLIEALTAAVHAVEGAPGKFDEDYTSSHLLLGFLWMDICTGQVLVDPSYGSPLTQSSSSFLQDRS